MDQMIERDMNAYYGKNNAREVLSLIKMYTNESKYSGTNDSFAMKWKIFQRNCGHAGIQPSDMPEVFPYMLTGQALLHYQQNEEQFSTMTCAEQAKTMSSYFEGTRHRANLMHEWKSITLEDYIKANRGKSTITCLDMMINRLRQVQATIRPAGNSEDEMRMKLITACDEVPIFRIALLKPATSEEVISDLKGVAQMTDRSKKTQSHTPIASSNQHMSSPEDAPEDECYYNDDDSGDGEYYYTDRRYMNYRGQRGRGYGNRRSSHLQNFPPRRQGSGNQAAAYPPYPRPPPLYTSPPVQEDQKDQRTNGDGQKRCFVCNKPGCWSTNHPYEERKTSYRQFVKDVEGEAPGKENIKDDATVFYTSVGAIDGTKAYNAFANESLMHAITAINHRSCNDSLIPKIAQTPIPASANGITIDPAIHHTRYTEDAFYGIMIDTGASMKSSCGIAQFNALNRDHHIQVDEEAAGKTSFQFGAGKSTKSLGTACIATPIGNIVVHIIDADTPFLLSLQDLDGSGFYYNNQTDYLVNSATKHHIKVIRRFHHAWITWGDAEANAFINAGDESQLTEQQMRQLHKRFAAVQLGHMLARSGKDFSQKALERLTDYCKHCQLHQRSPGRFRFTIQDDRMDFNASIIVDIMYINDNSTNKALPVLHIVDEATKFQAARFLDNEKAEHVWDTLRECWIDAYLGPPDVIIHDSGKNFKGMEFNARARAMAIKIDVAAVEAHHSIGLVERYHAPLRRAFQAIQEDLPGVNRKAILQMATKGMMARKVEKRWKKRFDGLCGSLNQGTKTDKEKVASVTTLPI